MNFPVVEEESSGTAAAVEEKERQRRCGGKRKAAALPPLPWKKEEKERGERNRSIKRFFGAETEFLFGGGNRRLFRQKQGMIFLGLTASN